MLTERHSLCKIKGIAKVRVSQIFGRDKQLTSKSKAGKCPFVLETAPNVTILTFHLPRRKVATPLIPSTSRSIC